MQIPPKVQYTDRPDLPETFVDSIHATFFDGQTFRIEFCVTRMEEHRPPNPPVASRFPVCRLVIPPKTMIEFFNQLHGFMEALESNGMLQRVEFDTPPTRQ